MYMQLCKHDCNVLAVNVHDTAQVLISVLASNHMVMLSAQKIENTAPGNSSAVVAVLRFQLRPPNSLYNL
jgi:hypothetical protein